MNKDIKDTIDTIMAEMEAQTPKPSDSNKTFESFAAEKVPETVFVSTASAANNKVADDLDAKSNGVQSSNFQKPGKLYPSRATDKLYYDSCGNVGYALIFSQEKSKGEPERKGSKKDASDLEVIFSDLGLSVEVCTNYTIRQIQNQLFRVSEQDHSDNDCLVVVFMSHGDEDGKISAADGLFTVKELWTPFVGDNCRSLIGKPKLFFIQACRGKLVDPGVILKTRPLQLKMMSDTVDARRYQEHFAIPSLADLLVMYSSAEGYYSFRNPTDGSWFIQALCDELRENPKNDLLTILTGVNRRVAFAKQSNIEEHPEMDAMKQMPNLVSMLTKTFYFRNKDWKFQLESV